MLHRRLLLSLIKEEQNDTKTENQVGNISTGSRDGRQKYTPYPCANTDELYEELEDWDALSEVRQSGVTTGLSCENSRHYESEAVAIKMPDGSWVGWTYWYGGGKYGEPEGIDWIEDAYDVYCHEEEKVVVVQTFSLP